jgi:hypothetical protein
MRITTRGPALALSALPVAAALAGCASSGGTGATPGASPHPAASGSVQWATTPALPTVAQVAAQMKATGATGNCGGGTAVGITDSGYAHLGKERVAINIFPSNTLRNSWETGIAANAGAVIVAQGTDWVAYKALNQAGTGCN